MHEVTCTCIELHAHAHVYLHAHVTCSSFVSIRCRLPESLLLKAKVLFKKHKCSYCWYGLYALNRLGTSIYMHVLSYIIIIILLIHSLSYTCSICLIYYKLVALETLIYA